MIHFIILLLVFIVGIILYSASYRGYFMGLVMWSISGLLLIFHLIQWLIFAPYEYSLFLNERNAFQQTLTESRRNGNEYESAAIVKEISNWNVELAQRKYHNSIGFLDCYIDDRTETLQPIK